MWLRTWLSSPHRWHLKEHMNFIKIYSSPFKEINVMVGDSSIHSLELTSQKDIHLPITNLYVGFTQGIYLDLFKLVGWSPIIWENHYENARGILSCMRCIFPIIEEPNFQAFHPWQSTSIPQNMGPGTCISTLVLCSVSGIYRMPIHVWWCFCLHLVW